MRSMPGRGTETFDSLSHNPPTATGVWPLHTQHTMKQASNTVSIPVIPLLVTTAHKGVFFGYGVPVLAENKSIRIERAQMCVHWSADVKGITGLAATGPTKGCRIGPAAPAITLMDVTSVMEVSADAAKKWEGAPWS